MDLAVSVWSSNIEDDKNPRGAVDQTKNQPLTVETFSRSIATFHTNIWEHRRKTGPATCLVKISWVLFWSAYNVLILQTPVTALTVQFSSAFIMIQMRLSFSWVCCCARLSRFGASAAAKSTQIAPRVYCLVEFSQWRFATSLHMQMGQCVLM